jgi:hypothetical protein
MGAFTELLRTTFVGVVASLVTLCLPLLSPRVRTKPARRETASLGFHSSGVSRLPGACCG